ncbi:MAG: sensor histidine kinase, partial [Alphaproteobacteria bacterium]|nr:sensor histidine kinase [Alphaproteobacteria bacterium]MBU1794648.1 sensor histidine kinase [Alphaproteobacteria bacterium]
MFLILTLALLPLGLIALIASLQAIRTADLEKDALLRVAVTQSARKLTADLLSDRTALELTVNTLANDGGDQSICQRLELFLTSHDRDGGLFYIYDRRGKRLCGSAAPEPAGIVFGARFKGRAAQLLPASNVLVSRVRSRNGKLVGLAYYSQAHLESVADPATALQNRQLTLRQGDARMVISRPGGTQITGRASSLS